jgi:hypothetical protein
MRFLILDLLVHGQFLPVSLRFRISQSVVVVAEVVRAKLQALQILVQVVAVLVELFSHHHFQLPVVHQSQSQSAQVERVEQLVSMERQVVHLHLHTHRQP